MFTHLHHYSRKREAKYMARSAQVQEPRKNGEAKIAINAKHLLLKG